MRASIGIGVAFFTSIAAVGLPYAAVIPVRTEPPGSNGVLVRVGAYETSVIARGLSRPTGIALDLDGNLLFTEVPMPGVGGGLNGVSRLNEQTGEIELLHQGEPDPQNLSVGPDGSIYWTCRSAGVILERLPTGETAPLLVGLARPTGISVASDHEIYFTQVPTPGVPGQLGGSNTVNLYSGAGIEVLTLGEPEPTDIVVGPGGDLYWTCKSAGVVLHRTPDGQVGLLLRNLQSPTGIALSRDGNTLYLTEVPTPGIPGSRGGYNAVTQLDLHSGQRALVDFGDPEPTDIAVDDAGNVYWTCSSAGVIVRATPN